MSEASTSIPSIGQFKLFRYMNYAYPTQDIINSHGSENVEFLRNVSRFMIWQRCFRHLYLEVKVTLILAELSVPRHAPGYGMTARPDFWKDGREDGPNVQSLFPSYIHNKITCRFPLCASVCISVRDSFCGL